MGEKLTKYGLIRNLNDCDLYIRLLEYFFNYLIKLNISIRYVMLVFNVIFKVFLNLWLKWKFPVFIAAIYLFNLVIKIMIHIYSFNK